MAWSALLLLVNGVATLGLLRVLLTNAADDAIELELQQEVLELREIADGPVGDESVMAVLQEFLRTSVPAENEVQLTLFEGEPLERSQDADTPRLDLEPDLVATWAAATDVLRGSTQLAQGRVEWVVVPIIGPINRGSLVVAVVADARSAPTDRAVLIAGGLQLGVGALLLAVLGARLSRGLARPLARLTESTRAIQAGRLEGRLPVVGDDEVADLARTLNDLLGATEEEMAVRRRLVADAGHELRTPITIVRGHLELLSEDPQERAETLALVDDELHRMSGLVNDLLALATADQPGFVKLFPVDLDEFGQRLLQTVQPLAGRDWVLEADAVPAQLDPQRVRQAVVALIDNAVRFTGEGDRITLRLRRPSDDEVVVEVTDQGAGIDPDLLEEVFAPFRHGSSVRSGTGIGLALVAAIARAHGGEARVASTVGQGTTVTLHLPQEA